MATLGRVRARDEAREKGRIAAHRSLRASSAITFAGVWRYLSRIEKLAMCSRPLISAE